MAWYNEYPQTDTYGSTWGIKEGYRTRPAQHIDIGTPSGTRLTPREPGRLVNKGTDPQLGIYADIQDKQGRVWRYFHLSSVPLKVGDYADENTVFGIAGNTGSSSGPHTSIRLFNSEGTIIDPTPFVSAEGGDGMPPKGWREQEGTDGNMYWVGPLGEWYNPKTQIMQADPSKPWDEANSVKVTADELYEAYGKPEANIGGGTGTGGSLETYTDPETGLVYRVTPGKQLPDGLNPDGTVRYKYSEPTYTLLPQYAQPGYGKSTDAESAAASAAANRAQAANLDKRTGLIDKEYGLSEEETAANVRASDAQVRSSDASIDIAKRKQDLEENQSEQGTWQQRAADAYNMGNLAESARANKVLEELKRDELNLKADIEYAESERADVKTNLERQNQAFTQQMDLRNQAIELAKSPRSYLEQAAIAGGYELPDGITLFDTLERAGKMVPTTEEFLESQKDYQPTRKRNTFPENASLVPGVVPEGSTTAATRNIADWANMGNAQALKTFSAAELATGDLKHAVGLGNEELNRIGDAYSGGRDAYLKQFSKDRIMGTGQYAGSGFGMDVQERLYGGGGGAVASVAPPSAPPPPAASLEPPEVRAQRLAEQIKQRQAAGVM